jgi:peptidoglycan/LPS O-acetylase OafA/YrhL
LDSVDRTAPAQGHDSVEWTSREHIPALDGVRGLAILLVMLFHMNVVAPVTWVDRLWSGFVINGSVGVDVFFVLSGFLITGILLDAKGAPHYFRNFYVRRVLRIFPLYYAVVAFSLLILPHIHNAKSAKFGSVSADAGFYWLHLSNFAIARRGMFVHGILDVSWSLAIEEQFYLIWPAVVLLTSPRGLKRICAALIALSCLSRLVLLIWGANQIAIHTLTFCRMDGLAMGALVAVAVRQSRPDRWCGVLRWAGSAALLGLLALWGPAALPWARQANVVTGHALVSFGSAAAILLIATGEAPWLAGAFSIPILRMLGRYSYALYLFHYPLMAIVRDSRLGPGRFPTFLGSPMPGQIVFVLLSSALSLACAWVSWHVYEKRFLRLKSSFELSTMSRERLFHPEDGDTVSVVT